jgi:hypothetical protein
MDRNSAISFSGTLSAKVIRAPQASIGWKLKNALTTRLLAGLLAVEAAKLFSRLTGIPTITSQLEARLIRADGTVVNYGVVSHRVVTDAGVAYLVDDWDTAATEITNMNYHGCGTGTVAEAAADTALGAECTTVLNPDSTRATGTKSQPAANQLRSVGTPTFDGSAAVTEHGLFSQAATGGGTLWDRSVFAAINVGTGDSIQFTYTMTVNSGG